MENRGCEENSNKFDIFVKSKRSAHPKPVKKQPPDSAGDCDAALLNIIIQSKVSITLILAYLLFCKLEYFGIMLTSALAVSIVLKSDTAVISN